MELVTNPPIEPATADAVVGLWTDVSRAGGAVGFHPDVARADVAQTADRALARVAAGAWDLVAAREGDRLVGLAFLAPGSPPLTGHLGSVKRLQRAPDRRGVGIGSRLLAGVEAAARHRGLSLLTLTVRGGTGREAFYAAHGYRIDGRLPARLQVSDGTLVEEIHMSKPIADAVPATTVSLYVQRLDPDLPLPSYAHAGDAGLDLRAAAPVELAPGERASVPTGVAVAIPQGCVGLVHPRSGLAARHGLAIVNAPGTIDAGYRGEIRVLLVNLDPRATVTLDRGDRIAQLLVQRIEHADVVEVSTLDDTTRGTGGFGSTGR